MNSIKPLAAALCLGLAGTAAQAQFGGNTCTSVAGTYPAQAPLTSRVAQVSPSSPATTEATRS